MKVLQDITEKQKEHAVTPEANQLFRVNITLDKLSEADVQTFHTLVEKLLFLSKRAQPEILTSVFFLTTIVRDSR